MNRRWMTSGSIALLLSLAGCATGPREEPLGESAPAAAGLESASASASAPVSASAAAPVSATASVSAAVSAAVPASVPVPVPAASPPSPSESHSAPTRLPVPLPDPPPTLAYPPSGASAIARTLRPAVEWNSTGPPDSLWELIVTSPGANTIRAAARGRRFALGEDLQPGRQYEVRVRAWPVPDRPAGRWSDPGLLILPAEPPEPRPVEAITRTPGEDETSPAPSPDGESLAYRVRAGVGGPRAVVRRIVRGPAGALGFGEPWRIDSRLDGRVGSQLDGPPSWISADHDAGWSLAFSSAGDAGDANKAGDEAKPAASLFRQEMSGSPPMRMGPPGISAPLGRVSAAGGSTVRIYYEGPEGGEIWSALADGSGRALVAEGTAPQVSPDGRFLAYVSDRSGAPDLWLLRIGGEGRVGGEERGGGEEWGGGEERIAGEGSSKPLLRNTNPFVRIESPAWSPSMDSIAFAADIPPQGDQRAGNLDIHLLEIESGLVHPLTRSLADDTDPAFFPDGEGGSIGILFSSRRANGSFDLFIAR